MVGLEWSLCIRPTDVGITPKTLWRQNYMPNALSDAKPTVSLQWKQIKKHHQSLACFTTNSTISAANVNLHFRWVRRIGERWTCRWCWCTLMTALFHVIDRCCSTDGIHVHSNCHCNISTTGLNQMQASYFISTLSNTKQLYQCHNYLTTSVYYIFRHVDIIFMVSAIIAVNATAQMVQNLLKWQ